MFDKYNYVTIAGLDAIINDQRNHKSKQLTTIFNTSLSKRIPLVTSGQFVGELNFRLEQTHEIYLNGN